MQKFRKFIAEARESNTTLSESTSKNKFDKAFEEVKKHIKKEIPQKWTRKIKYADDSVKDRMILGVYFNIDLDDIEDDIGEDYVWDIMQVGKKYGVEVEVAKSAYGSGIKWIR